PDQKTTDQPSQPHQVFILRISCAYGHPVSAFGTKRTSQPTSSMSAFGGKADIESITRELRFAEVTNLIGSGVEGSSFSATPSVRLETVASNEFLPNLKI